MSAGPQIASDWWQSFFDQDYVLIWSGMISDADSRSHCDALWQLLQLRESSRVLDAGCGYGRLSRPLAERGATVVGVDQSAEMLAHAERARGDIPESRLRYVRHDLRSPLQEGGFDAAFNAFTGIGYGSEDDDLAILVTIHDAVRPGGLVLVEAIQRDAVVAFMARGGQQASRRPDGILVFHESVFDPVEGRIRGTWYWAGAQSRGQKAGAMRVYTVGELIRLLQSAGLLIRGLYLGLSTEPFKQSPPEMGGRVGLLAQRPE